MHQEDAPWRELYPFESHFLRLNELSYHYLDEGEGAPLLMVHGNPTWSFYWRRLTGAFRDRFRIIVPDHMGCGLSDKPQNYQYTLQQHTANLIQLIETLNLEGITLLAHDWGGAIGLGAATAQPERFSRIVLFNTGAFPPPFIPCRIRMCRTPLLGTWGMRGLNLFAQAALRMAVEDPKSLPPLVRAGLIAPYDSWYNRVAIDRFVHDIPMTKRHPTWKTLEDLEQNLNRLSELPIQLIWGMRDWCFNPSCLQRFREIWPHAAVCELPQAGHYVVEEAHEEIVECLTSFLETT